MNNLSSYCGLTDSRMRASKKDLPVHENELSSLTFHLILTDFFVCFWDAGQSGCSVCGMTIFCYPLHFLLIPPKVECKAEKCLHKTWLTKNF